MDSTSPTPRISSNPASAYRAAAERNRIRRAAEHTRREAERLAAWMQGEDLESTRVTMRPVG